jgi:hypothetical protein
MEEADSPKSTAESQKKEQPSTTEPGTNKGDRDMSSWEFTRRLTDPPLSERKASFRRPRRYRR